MRGRLVKLVKISDDKFEGVHPNGINQGNVYVGRELEGLEVGSRYKVYNENKLEARITSKVTEIVDQNTFKTENSTYKIEILKYEEL